MTALKLLGQFLLNILNLLDHAGNTLLLGDSDETMSARAARARNAGVKWAKWFCAFLTWGQIVVTFGKITRDHASYALDKSIKPNCREILDLNTWPPKIRKNPVNEVNPVEICDTMNEINQ